MKNYSRNNAGKGKTAFRTGDKWRLRKHIAVRDVKSEKRHVARMNPFKGLGNNT